MAALRWSAFFLHRGRVSALRNVGCGVPMGLGGGDFEMQPDRGWMRTVQQNREVCPTRRRYLRPVPSSRMTTSAPERLLRSVDANTLYALDGLRLVNPWSPGVV